MNSSPTPETTPPLVDPILPKGRHIALKIALVATTVILVGGGALGAIKLSHHGSGGKTSKDPAVQAGLTLSAGKCSGTGPATLTTSPMRPSDFTIVIPYGEVVGGHVTPIDHQYFSPADQNSPRDAYPVYAMGDSTIVSVEHRTQAIGANTGGKVTSEYRIIFSYSCTFFSYYDLVTSLSPDLQAAFDREQHNNSAGLDIAVKSGQQIGSIGGQTLDFAVWNTQKPVTGFVVPSHYNAEAWKIYTADPLDYYSPSLKAAILTRYPRTTAPLSGRPDWDIDGKLQGTWFQDGFPGYEGDQNNPNGYWVTHLSFAPDLYDNSHFIISMGNYGGQAKQFNALGNTPLPADVGVASGLIKYSLVADQYFTLTGQPWDQHSIVKGLQVRELPNESPQGVVLVQMEDARTIKFEAFPGKTAAQVTIFDSNAKLYHR